MKYESSITYQSKDVANVKFLKSRSKFKVKAGKSKILVQIERSSIRNTHMKYKSSITYYSKDMANVNVLKSKSNFKVRRSKILLSIERPFHKEYTYQI
jgi:hypothetical protein